MPVGAPSGLIGARIGAPGDPVEHEVNHLIEHLLFTQSGTEQRLLGYLVEQLVNHLMDNL